MVTIFLIIQSLMPFVTDFREAKYFCCEVLYVKKPYLL